MRTFGLLRIGLIAAFSLILASSGAHAAANLCNGRPNGTLDGNEQCETGPCCSSKCELLGAATVCRAAGSNATCDPEEVCGAQVPAVDAACPMDLVADDGTACDDGQFCNIGETCTAGACGGGSANDCSDANACTSDTCNEAQDICQHGNAVDGTPCDDGSACTTGDSCTGGVCAGVAKVCNDSNACTDDSCDAANGECVFTNNTAPCDDGQFCTTGDACAGGACAGGPGNGCDDGLGCTTDLCNEADDSCMHETAPDGSACEDGQFCTINDTCSGGVCQPGPANTCDDANECTKDTCNEGSDQCKHAQTNNNGPCEDGDYCTVDETCSGGVCSGVARNCDDTNICTDDSCDEDADACVNANNAEPCDDGLYCTVGDTCSGGACTGAARDCGDGNVCTTDSCDDDNDICTNVDNTDPCEDGDFCTVGDVCAEGECTAGPARDCADANACTTDSCNEDTNVCDNVNNTDPCDDGMYCTVGDTCGDGACAGTTRDCDDANVCTTDSCDEDNDECDNDDNTGPCEDGDFCTENDVCGGGSCNPGAARTCDDSDTCTDDSCDEDDDKCVNEPNSSTSCDDGDFCTVDDVCNAGECVGTPRDCADTNDCTTDSCDEDADACVNANNAEPCDDGDFCTVDDVCGGGECAGVPNPCSDNNDCTTDSCDEEAGECGHENNADPCEDGDFCTENDVCSGGECTSGGVKDCDDSSLCTDDSCDEEANACVNTPNEVVDCDDGMFCTTGDQCDEGVCGGVARDCSDNNDCTDDSCDEAGGKCANTNNSDPCDDGMFCTVEDACDGGVCTGASRDCDDSNVCTDDACNEVSDECDAINNAAPCDDGIFCNGIDSCSGGLCDVHPGDPCDGADGDEDCTETCDEDADDCEGDDPEESACTDFDVCTVGDTCEEGICVPGEPEDMCTTSTTTTLVTTTTDLVTTTTALVTTTTEQPGPLCGDYNGDGELKSSDALGVLQTAVGINECALSVCDFNGSGEVTSLDALAVLRASVGLPSNPMCPPEVASLGVRVAPGTGIALA